MEKVSEMSRIVIDKKTGVHPTAYVEMDIRKRHNSKRKM